MLTVVAVGGVNVSKVAVGLLSVKHTHTQEYMHFKCRYYCLRVNLSRIEITADSCHNRHQCIKDVTDISVVLNTNFEQN